MEQLPYSERRLSAYPIEMWKKLVMFCGGGSYIFLSLIMIVFFQLYSVLESPMIFVTELFGNAYTAWKIWNVGWAIFLTAKEDYYFWEKW